MRLALTQAEPACRVSCCSCGESYQIGNVLADLDGEPFKAYYCRGCLGVRSLWQADELFGFLGATHYHDSHYPASRNPWTLEARQGGLFSRHYFKDGVEIGLCIPDLMPEGGLQWFDTPRVWGIPHDLNPL